MDATCVAAFCGPPGPPPVPLQAPNRVCDPCAMKMTASASRRTARARPVMRWQLCHSEEGFELEVERHAPGPHRALVGELELVEARDIQRLAAGVGRAELDEAQAVVAVERGVA